MLVWTLAGWCLLTTAVVPLLTTAQPLDGNPQDCINSEFDPTVDYFPDKVVPEHSQYWNITYHNHYKLLYDLAEGLTYALVQCGTSLDDIPSGVTAVFSIPSTTTAIGYGPAVGALLELGITEYEYYILDESFLQDPCLVQDVENGDLLLQVPPLDDRTVTFLSPFGFATVPNVLLEDYLETSTKATYEWMKVYSAFYNREAQANQIMQAAQDAYQCVGQAAIQTFNAPVTAVWIDYNDFCEGFSVSVCPNFYCEMAQTCQVTLLTDPDNAGQIIDCPFDVSLYPIEQLVEFVADADLIFYGGEDWNILYQGDRRTQLDRIPAVQQQQVYDFQKRGPDAWYDESIFRYYDVVQDMCSIVGKTTPPELGWFRNVFTEPVGDPGACPSLEYRTVSARDGVCDVDALLPLSPNAPSAPSSSGGGGIPSIFLVDPPSVTAARTLSPTSAPVAEPDPVLEPTVEPTTAPTTEPTREPTAEPTLEPTLTPDTANDTTMTPVVDPTVSASSSFDRLSDYSWSRSFFVLVAIISWMVC